MTKFIRIQLKADTLKDIHEEIDIAKADGWKVAGPLSYAHQDGATWWEVPVERELETWGSVIKEEDYIFADDDLNGSPTAGYVIFVLSVIVAAGIVGAMIYFGGV